MESGIEIIMKVRYSETLTAVMKSMGVAMRIPMMEPWSDKLFSRLMKLDLLIDFLQILEIFNVSGRPFGECFG